MGTLRPVKTRPQDILWIAVGALVVFSVFVGILTLMTDRANWVVTLIGVLPASWIALGCWRRTKWGAPEDGLRADQERRATEGAGSG